MAASGGWWRWWEAASRPACCWLRTQRRPPAPSSRTSSLRSSRLCVLRCCGELLVSGLLQPPPAASLSWLAQQLSVICHVSHMSVSRVISLHAWLARLLTPDFLEQTDEPQAVGIWDLGIGLGILSPLNI